MKTYSKKCILCGAIASVISDADIENKTSCYYSYKATKYCCSCADLVYQEQHRTAQRRYKQNRKRINQLKDKRLLQLTEYSTLLNQENNELQNQIDILKRKLYEIGGYDET